MRNESQSKRKREPRFQAPAMRLSGKQECLIVSRCGPPRDHLSTQAAQRQQFQNRILYNSNLKYTRWCEEPETPREKAVGILSYPSPLCLGLMLKRHLEYRSHSRFFRSHRSSEDVLKIFAMCYHFALQLRSPLPPLSTPRSKWFLCLRRASYFPCVL